VAAADDDCVVVLRHDALGLQKCAMTNCACQ
jgi:hypothetical protein